MQRVSIPRQWSNVMVEKGAALDDGVVLLATGEPRDDAKISIRSATYINRFTMIDASLHIDIGRNCMIGPHCYITDHDHAHAPGVLVGDQKLVGAPVLIGIDVGV